MANDAVTANPTTAVQHITERGSDWLWAVFAIMLFSDILVFSWQFKLPRGQRVFHQLSIIILSMASIAYFSMASNLGYASIPTEFAYMGFPAGVTRQLWYVRYIDWVITTPCLLATLVLASALPTSDILTLMFFDLVMIVTGLVGGLVVSSYKWGFFAFGCAALVYIWWVLVGPARSSAEAIGPKFKSAFTTSAAILSFLWLLYPIAWGLADGGAVISPDSEMIFYGILDVLAKPVFCFFHLYTLSKLDLTQLQLSSGKFSNGVGAVNAYDREKQSAAGINSYAAGPTFGNGTQAAPAKKGFFGKRGQHDVAPATTAVDNPPRQSNAATIVSH